MDGMIPQGYPLACARERETFLVIGWTTAGKPVVVRDAAPVNAPASSAVVLDGPVRYFLPETPSSVTVDGTVDAMVEANVKGRHHNEAILVRRDD